MASAVVANGTYIIPANFPTVFRPDQLDKLGYTAAITLAWPSIIGGIILLLATRDWRRFSYTPLCVAWFWSVAVVAFGIFSRYGVFNHFVSYLAIAHIQVEWYIITFLLGKSFVQAYTNSTIVGLVLYIALMGYPGIRSTFLTTSVIGGFGDVFMPLLLWNGGQRFLAVGAIGHFLNAFVTFTDFVRYLPLELYFILQLVTGFMHVTFTVLGIFRLQAQAKSSSSGLIHLADDNDVNDPSVPAINGSAKSSATHPIIPPPSTRTILKLGGIALALSLVASIPLNFAIPKV